MDFQNLEKQLKKVTRLVETIKEDGQLKSIEKDLLLSYLREFYENVLTLDTSQYEKRNVVQDTKSKENIVNRDIQENIPSFESPTFKTIPSQEVIPEEVVPHLTIIEPIQPPQILAATIPDDVNALFEDDDVSELSDRLSRTKITDLSMAMGINERIFTVNELFGGDNNLFNKTITDLNTMRDNTSAKQYIIEHLVSKMNWTEPSKVKKAEQFVKLVMRRYV